MTKRKKEKQEAPKNLVPVICHGPRTVYVPAERETTERSYVCLRPNNPSFNRPPETENAWFFWPQAYTNPLLAALISPGMEGLKDPVLHVCEASGTIYDYKMRVACQRMAYQETIPMPVVDIETAKKFVLRLTLYYSKSTKFDIWGKKVLSTGDPGIPEDVSNALLEDLDAVEIFLGAELACLNAYAAYPECYCEYSFTRTLGLTAYYVANAVWSVCWHNENVDLLAFALGMAP